MQRKTKNSLAIRSLARGGLIAALYVTLTYVAAMLGLSSGVIQFRISEALCVLPIFMAEAIPALAIGCLISNLITGCVIWDVIFGAVATLLGAIGAYLLKRLPTPVVTLPTVLSNAIIVPFVLKFAYKLDGGYFFFMLTVGLGEIVCATLLGTLLAEAIKKTRIFDRM